MARNVEIKARIESVEALVPRVAALACSGPFVIYQDDTFFACPNGRLKLRIFSRAEGQLIFYRRQDIAGPKESFYLISPTTSPYTLLEALSFAYGQTGRVKKHRTLFLIGRTRVHLDCVDDRGYFLELEVVLGEQESTSEGMTITHELLARLGISPTQLVEGAYVDMHA